MPKSTGWPVTIAPVTGWPSAPVTRSPTAGSGGAVVVVAAVVAAAVVVAAVLGGGGSAVKLAPTERFVSIVTVHLLLPEQSPLQPSKCQPEAGDSLSETLSESLKSPLHVF